MGSARYGCQLIRFGATYSIMDQVKFTEDSQLNFEVIFHWSVLSPWLIANYFLDRDKSEERDSPWLFECASPCMSRHAQVFVCRGVNMMYFLLKSPARCIMLHIKRWWANYYISENKAFKAGRMSWIVTCISPWFWSIFVEF